LSSLRASYIKTFASTARLDTFDFTKENIKVPD